VTTVDIWNKNILEDLEAEILEYETAGEFLVDLKKKFGGEKEEIVKVAELRRVKQKKRQ